ncbi:lactate 2-monooxygenase [Aquisalimonas asiatica]|uniref:Lactate 2-monooxygenase n=1 Tax=Aquisalimonas asiatica TaxID=406100 RepID=A0A1H8PKU0_9GAMM|nr:lactate 2-monooxygenase [Aquisalimonas asiatica]SEO42347.1 lactate 2-monooxygenase [Aquisalimonas asiatica]
MSTAGEHTAADGPMEGQRAIYSRGLAAKQPQVPTDYAALEARAERCMSAQAFAYIAGGAGREDTVARNRSAFGQWQIVPQMLRDVGERDTSITLFGQRLPSPFLLSPVGVLEMAHPDADLAVARAAAAARVPYIFSNQASRPMETCAAAMGDAPRWFQLYWSKSDALVKSLVQRAEGSGCSAIVVTLDTTLLGWRSRDLDLGYLPFLRGRGIAQYTSDPVFLDSLDEPLPAGAQDVRPPVNLHTLRAVLQAARAFPGGTLAGLRSGRALAAVRRFIATYSRPTLTWENLAFLREHTRLPVLLKGVLDPDDARRALDHGVDGLIVSNHGGRQVDGAVSTIEQLPRIRDAVAGRLPLILDSGVRGGADAFKALALGATAVGIGRPYCYGLAIAGEAGVGEVIANLRADFELTMALAGCRSISEVTPERLRADAAVSA